MIIDETTYALLSNNYIPKETDKKQIIIGHTGNNNMKHVIGWKHRNNGSYKKTAAFTIDVAGSIYRHFDPKFTSMYFNDKKLCNKSIVILLENDGWLVKDVQNNQFLTWIGDIYKEPNGIVEKKWRGYNYWCPYTEEQTQSTQDLVRMLCNEFSIPLTSISHNTKIDNLLEYEGVIYKSNLSKDNTDLSPAWDCESFKNKIELI